MTETIYTNALPVSDNVDLSIVTPFHKNDPALLLTILARQVMDLNIELIVIDDGSQCEALTAGAQALIADFPAPASLITFHDNHGRSCARNRLIKAARAPYILFLDSDMAPDSERFVRDWLDLIVRTKPTIAYGGFTTLQVPDVPELALARALAQRGDCHGARERVRRGPLAVATSNLLVRSDIMKEVSFDSDFSGWGWEDVDWALRAVNAGYAVAHVPIPATHMGLDIPEVLMDKFAKAGPNFRKIVARHPCMLTTQGTRLAKILALLPLKGQIKKWLYATAINPKASMSSRSRAARIWRALWAA